MDKNAAELAELVRTECIKAAKEAFQDASIRGLCADGAMEAAVGAIHSLDMDKIIQKRDQSKK
jgi:hypothetical protein